MLTIDAPTANTAVIHVLHLHPIWGHGTRVSGSNKHCVGCGERVEGNN